MANNLKLKGGINLPPQAAPATTVAGDMYYDSTANKFRVNENGIIADLSSSVGSNFIKNDAANSSTTGWATYADAAAARPVDGTGGTANVTWTTSATAPLSGDSSFIFTKDAANRQGQGVSYDFTIDNASKAKVLKVELDYIINSGTFVAGNLTTDSDLIVYLYDKDSSTLIEPTSFKLLSNSSTISDKFKGTFQTSATSTNYRLIIHVASTSASAYTVKFDNINVTTSQYVYGTPISDWTSYTPTGTWTVNTTYQGRWRRVGDTMELEAVATCSGAPNATAFGVNLPAGYTTDTTKTLASTANVSGFASLLDGGTIYLGQSSVSGSQIIVRNWFTNGTYATHTDTSATSPFSFGAADTVFVKIAVPILGWSSSVQMSDSADTRVCVLTATKTATQVISNNTQTTLIFGTVYNNTHGAYNASTGVFTAPVAGYYRISAQCNAAGTFAAGPFFLFAVNSTGGVGFRIGNNYAAANTQTGVSGSGVVYASAGDQLFARFVQVTGGSVTLEAEGTLVIERVTGPSAITAQESVNMTRKALSGQSISGSDAPNTVQFGTAVYDTHNAWDATNHRYVVPVTGKYRVATQLVYAGAAWTASNRAYAMLAKNGGAEMGLGHIWIQASVTMETVVTGSAEIQCNAGDTLQVFLYHNLAAARSLTGAGLASQICITKVGN